MKSNEKNNSKNNLSVANEAQTEFVIRRIKIKYK